MKIQPPLVQRNSLGRLKYASWLLLIFVASGAWANARERTSKVSPEDQNRYTPPTGNRERKAIALALHGPCEQDLKQKVILKFDQLRVVRDWALARVRPFQPNEKPIDYRKTKYKKQVEEGMFDGTGEALLQRRHGRWTVLEWRFGHTDTEMSEWLKKHRAPKVLAE